MRPNWVEISRAALRGNFDFLRSRLAPGTGVCAIVKANAYGHGLLEAARVFAAAGAAWLGVTSVDEGLRLRQAGLRQRILVLGGIAAEEAAAVVEAQLTPAVWDEVQLEWLSAAVQAHPPASPFPVHLKIDSGMGRLGLMPEQEAAFLAALARSPQLEVEAIFSHLHSAEVEDDDASVEQRNRLQKARERILPHLRPHRQRAWHLLNSAGVLRHAAWGGDLVRLGLSLYGYAPAPLAAPELQPALTWKTRIIGLKTLPPGHPVGYGARYRTRAVTRVATLAAGYADGYSRAYTGAHVALHGRRCPVIGNISMDMAMIDVSAVAPAALGDEVTLLGGDTGSAHDLAALAGTIPYEVLCRITARVERRWE